MKGAVLAVCVAALVLSAAAADDDGTKPAGDDSGTHTSMPVTGTTGSGGVTTGPVSMAKKLFILPLGDSITFGSRGGCSSPGELAPVRDPPSDSDKSAAAVEKDAEALAAAAAGVGATAVAGTGDGKAGAPAPPSPAAAKKKMTAQGDATTAVPGDAEKADSATGAPKPPTRVVVPKPQGARDEAGCVGGYRAYLWRALNAGTNANNRRAKFVGTLTSGPADIDAAHEGHSGATVADLNAKVPAALDAVGPIDAVLLHIGTNDAATRGDMTQVVGELKALLTTIATKAPDAVVFVAAILPIFNSDKNVGGEQTIAVDALNDAIVKLTKLSAAPEQGVTLPKRLVLVDMRSAASQISASDMADALHPNAFGYSKMSVQWTAALRKAFPELDGSMKEWDKVAAVATTETRESATPNTAARSHLEVHATDADAEFDWNQPAVVLLLLVASVAFAAGMTIGAYSMVCARTPGLSGASSNGFEV